MEGYFRRWARATRDGAYRRVGTSIGCLSLLVVPIVAALAVFVVLNSGRPTPEQNQVNAEALSAAVVGAVVAVVGWGFILLIWSAIQAPAEMDAARLSERDAERSRADEATLDLRTVLESLLGVVTLEYIAVSLGKKPEEETGLVRVGIVLRNSSQIPLRFRVTVLHAVIESHSAAGEFQNQTGYLPPFGATIRFDFHSILDLQWKFPMTGEVTFAVAYGPAARDPEYTFSGKATFFLAAAADDPKQIGVQWVWVGEPNYERAVGAQSSSAAISSQVQT